ncbi:MAG: TonB-dependent receptor plug domain-containing protein [Chitinophagia bacterium]|jgi:TonB-dependent SusC/RagA subfamily outer membrane receptor
MMPTIKSVYVCLLLLISAQSVYAQAKPNTILPGSYNNIFELLREIPGLEVKTNTGRSGGSVIVRGVGSFNNQQNPLIVIDGVIYNGDLSTINPKDVDGIDILKDASTSGAYGSRGAFGVIVITLKKGASLNSVPKVNQYSATAFTYFIEHASNIRIFGLKDQVLIEGVIKEQRKEQLVFIKKRKEVLINLSDISRVEIIPE